MMCGEVIYNLCADCSAQKNCIFERKKYTPNKHKKPKKPKLEQGDIFCDHTYEVRKKKLKCLKCGKELLRGDLRKQMLVKSG